MINFIYLSIYLVNVYLHTEILTPRSSKSVENSNFYDFFLKWEFNFWDFWWEIYPLGTPRKGVRGSIWKNLFEYHESTWSVGLKNAITLRLIFQNSGVDCTPLIVVHNYIVLFDIVNPFMIVTIDIIQRKYYKSMFYRISISSLGAVNP